MVCLFDHPGCVGGRFRRSKMKRCFTDEVGGYVAELERATEK